MTAIAAAGRLLDVRTIYLEPEVAGYERGREILARFPDAERIEVPSHWRIPELHGDPDNASDWLRNVNFSPVIVREGWTARWDALLEQIDDSIGADAKAQLACEVIFLTHNERLHETNLAWHPKAEDLLWRPDLQEAKWSQNGQRNVRYARGKKARMVAELIRRIETRLPYCRVRYAF